MAGAPSHARSMAEIFSPRGHVAAMLAFEAALARAEARAGLIPTAAAEAIDRACAVERFDLDRLFAEAEVAGTPAIPLVRLLTALVSDAEARGSVHLGATSQDAIDTALVLQVRAGLDVLASRLFRVAGLCAELAERHRRTFMPGRTLLQHALPITFGLKAARWLGLVTRQIQSLQHLTEEVLVVQFGGAAGTLASLGDHGLRVQALLAEELGLGVPDLPWHAERDRVARLAAELGVLASSVRKIAGDLLLLMQTEVGEVMEASGPGKGGSSAMPHKRNPVDAVQARAAAQLALGLVPILLAGAGEGEQERAVGAWQAEWRALPELFAHVDRALQHLEATLAGLEVYAGRMASNLAMTHGLLLAESLTTALAKQVGRDQAYQQVQSLCAAAIRDGRSLAEVAEKDARLSQHLSEAAVRQALDPAGYLGSTDLLIDRALHNFSALTWPGTPPRRP